MKTPKIKLVDPRPMPGLGKSDFLARRKPLEETQLNKRQLKQLTDFYGSTDLLSVGELTKTQLQTHVYYLLKERNKTENALYRAQTLINSVLP